MRRLLVFQLVPCTLLLTLQVEVKRHWSKAMLSILHSTGRLKLQEQAIEPDTTLSGRLAFRAAI